MSIRTTPAPTMGINRPHEAIRHSVGEYARKQAHTNGLESFWAPMKRGYQGVYHKMSPKHLQRCANEGFGPPQSAGVPTP